MINDNTSQRFDNSITKKSEHFRLRLFYSIIHSKGIFRYHTGRKKQKKT